MEWKLLLICILSSKLQVASQGWEETVVKQEQSDEGSSEMKISLPSMPSLYVMSFLCRACEEIHRIGGHVLDKSIVQKFALSLIEKVRSLLCITAYSYLLVIPGTLQQSCLYSA